MRTGLVITAGIMGIFWLFFSVLLGVFKDRILKRDFDDTYNKKAIAKFMWKLYLTIGLICLTGLILGFLELLPILVLRIINYIHFLLIPISTIYLRKSKRYKYNIIENKSTGQTDKNYN